MQGTVGPRESTVVELFLSAFELPTLHDILRFLLVGGILFYLIMLTTLEVVQLSHEQGSVQEYPTCDSDFWNLYLVKNHQSVVGLDFEQSKNRQNELENLLSSLYSSNEDILKMGVLRDVYTSGLLYVSRMFYDIVNVICDVFILHLSWIVIGFVGAIVLVLVYQFFNSTSTYFVGQVQVKTSRRVVFEKIDKDKNKVKMMDKFGSLIPYESTFKVFVCLYSNTLPYKCSLYFKMNQLIWNKVGVWSRFNFWDYFNDLYDGSKETISLVFNVSDGEVKFGTQKWKPYHGKPVMIVFEISYFNTPGPFAMELIYTPIYSKLFTHTNLAYSNVVIKIT